MKKILLRLVIVLILVYIVFSLLGLGSDYNAERALWGINREFSKMAIQKESTPDYAIEQLATKYRSFVKKYPDSVFAQRGQLMLGELYALKKNFKQSRVEFQKTIGKDKNITAQASFAVGRTYEIEGSWSKALAIYKYIIENYPTTNSGFVVPMYLTSNKNIQSNKANLDEAYANAIVFYKKMIQDHPKSRLEFGALRNLILCQIYQKDWIAVIAKTEDLMMKYPVSKIIKESVNTINVLCITRLHDYGLAIRIYQRFINKYPDHPANHSLKKMLEKLKLLKERKLNITSGSAHTERSRI